MTMTRLGEEVRRGGGESVGVAYRGCVRERERERERESMLRALANLSESVKLRVLRTLTDNGVRMQKLPSEEEVIGSDRERGIDVTCFSEFE